MANYPTGVRPRGDTIQIRWQYKGREYTKTIKKTPNKTNIAYAAKVREEELNKLRFGINHTTDPDYITFGEMAEKYLKRKKPSSSTITTYNYLLNWYWLDDLGNIPLVRLQYADIEDCINNQVWPSDNTYKLALAPLMGVLKMAAKRGIIDPSISQNIEKVHPQTDPPDPWSLQEKIAILDALENADFPYPHALFCLMFEIGIRPGEALALNWSDYRNGRVEISKTRTKYHGISDTTKTRQARSVLLPPRAKAALQNLPSRFNKKGPIFLLKRGNPCVHQDRYLPEWKQALKDAGLDYKKMYNCRHTCASLGLTAGMKPGFLARQLGHSLQVFFKVYARWIDSEDDVEELKKMERWEEWKLRDKSKRKGK